MDERYNALVRQMLMSMTEDPGQVEPGVHILFVAKNLERIGDHATNVAEAVHFMVTAGPLEADDVKS